MLPPSSWSLLNGNPARATDKVYDIPPVIRRRPRRLRLRLRRAQTRH